MTYLFTTGAFDQETKPLKKWKELLIVNTQTERCIDTHVPVKR